MPGMRMSGISFFLTRKSRIFAGKCDKPYEM
jgi:hypothetical protein